MANACAMQFEATRTDPAPDAEALRLAASHARHACALDPDLAAARPGTVWLSNEAPGVLPDITARLPVPVPPGRTVLARDGRPVAFGMPHGQGLTWLD